MVTDVELEVWIGVVSVVPDEGCELLDPHKGAFTNILTLALSSEDYRNKVVSAMRHYKLRVLEMERVETLCKREARQGLSEELRAIASEITTSRHVRYTTFHTYPRLM